MTNTLIYYLTASVSFAVLSDNILMADSSAPSRPWKKKNHLYAGKCRQVTPKQRQVNMS